MRPVTDKFKVSRAKLAYLIDATAAPVCIIAPISSWAAAVTGFVEGEDGFSIFMRAIPYNFYAILAIANCPNAAEPPALFIKHTMVPRITRNTRMPTL